MTQSPQPATIMFTNMAVYKGGLDEEEYKILRTHQNKFFLDVFIFRLTSFILIWIAFIKLFID